MNVLFFTSWYPTREFTYGGVFVREQAKAVRHAGHRVVVLHLAGPSRDLKRSLWSMEQEFDQSLSEGIETHHVSHRKIPLRGASYLVYLWSAVAAYRRLRELEFRADVIHAHVYGAGVPAALIARRNRIPLVLTEHSSDVAQRSLGRVEARKAHFAYGSASRILPVSRFLGEAIRSYGIGRPLEVVPNVVDTSIFFPPEGPWKSHTSRRLLFVGNLESSHVKGFPTLLQALGLLRDRRRDWRLDVVGDGPERARYARAVTESGLDECLSFHGSRPKTGVAQAMREADLLVLPSRVESFGAVVAEALVSGLPVVSTNVGGIPELVDEGSGRLVPPDDPVALAGALDQALDDLGTFDRAAIANAARDLYSLEVAGERLSRIYASALTESGVDATHQARAGTTDSR